MAPPVISDEVVRRAQRGDKAAFEAIVAEFQTSIFNYILRAVGDRALAEDLTQDVFMRVYQKLPRFSFRSKFTTWLFQVAKNRVVDEFRSRERRPPAEELEYDTLRAADPLPEQSATIDAIWRAVERLPLDLRMSLLLRDVSGFAYDEIADITEATLSTVKWRIYQARELVAQSVADEGLIEARPQRGRAPARVG
jgi:RNA polymerase sigma-70 factor (ECF subfamily)